MAVALICGSPDTRRAAVAFAFLIQPAERPPVPTWTAVDRLVLVLCQLPSFASVRAAVRKYAHDVRWRIALHIPVSPPAASYSQRVESLSSLHRFRLSSYHSEC